VYQKQPERTVFPGGEALEGCFNRAVRTLHRIVEKESRLNPPHNDERGSDIAIVTHRVILKLMILGVLGLTTGSFWKLQLDTCSITEILEGEGSLILRRMNSTCHLSGMEERIRDF
jgi:probable phosphoglycerate mutase